MNRTLACLATFLFVLSCGGLAQANLLDDPSFEAATDGGQTSNSNWVLDSNFPSGNPPADPAAMYSTSVWAASDGDTGVWFRSFEGNQEEGDTPANALLSQTVSNVAQSGPYLLTFDSARETFFTAGVADARLTSSGGPSVAVDLLTATYNDTGNMNSDPTKFSLLLPGVNAGDDLTVSVGMIDGVDAMDNPQSLMVDNFSLTFIPEPTTIVLCGLSLLAVQVLRRRW